MMTLSISHSGWFGGSGYSSKTSSPAPVSLPFRYASVRVFREMTLLLPILKM